MLYIRETNEWCNDLSQVGEDLELSNREMTSGNDLDADQSLA